MLSPLTSIATAGSVLSMLLLSSASAAGQGCSSTSSKLSLAELSGQPIRSVHVVTIGPATLPSPAGRLSAYRGRTLVSTVRRQLLFAAGDTVDTLHVAETLRRLREESIFSDVSVSARQCVDGDPRADSLDVTVTTRDAWTLIPTAQVSPPSTVGVGLVDRDFLGTGRSVSISTLHRNTRSGGSISATDPWFLGTGLTAGFRLSRIGEIHQVRATLGTHLNSIYDEWSGDVVVGAQSQASSVSGTRLVRALFGDALAAPVVASSERSVTRLLFGAEFDSAATLRDTSGIGQYADVRLRRFIGGDVGLRHESAVFDTVGWFAPGRGFLDIPLDLQGEGIVGLGVEQTVRAVAAHYDLWLGRTFLPTRRSLLSVDAWTSGYLGGVRENHIDRFVLSAYHAAGSGYWGARVGLEQLLVLDPDLRLLSLMTTAGDPTFPGVPTRFRSANRIISVNMERLFHVHDLGRASVIDAGAYAGASERWDVRGSSAQLGVGVVGLRLRLLSANGVVQSSRVDVGWPIAGGSVVRRRPVVSISIAPLFDMARLRDMRRRQR